MKMSGRAVWLAATSSGSGVTAREYMGQKSSVHASAWAVTSGSTAWGWAWGCSGLLATEEALGAAGPGAGALRAGRGARLCQGVEKGCAGV